ncbi:HAMP domain-containing sensor histidine kinase [uncultured Turicimonas sp.]|uniref:sensor histidine kinase n=1 Tax=uncultured Turicimonas sp. TaxID=1918607 RepID=UPI00280404FC|nr:HAMP domain-containing sensor histidine kinase [uncultured Turicimonas sp.]
MSEIAKKRLKRLTQLEKRGMVSQISSVLAHELKQPISSVANYAKGLSKYLSKTNNSDEILHEAVREIDRGIRRAGDIVEKVRSYSKSSKDPLSVISLKDCAQRAIDSIKAFAPSQLQIFADLNSNPEIEADPLEIELLIFNLLKNAAEAVEPLGKNGSIICAIEESETQAILSVKDNGPRISSEKLEKMKSALQESVKPDGLGLGLSIILAIAEKYRAKIDFEQLEPQGLQISITFPEQKNENL